MGRPLSSCGPYHPLTQVLDFKGLKKKQDEQNENKRFPTWLFASRPQYKERETRERRRIEPSTGLPITQLSPSGLS